MNALSGTIKTQWAIVSFEKIQADKNIISSVPGPLGMSPPGPTRKKN